MKPNGHGRRATVKDSEYGRICACGDLKDQQALRCRQCYARHRRNEQARTCGCGGAKSRQSRQCRSCANLALIGNQHAAGKAQPQSHPWRKPFVVPRVLAERG